jgi:hypothetical protein
MVAVGGTAAAPAVLDRRRVELVASDIARSAQPYHAAAEMKLPAAVAFLARCADAADKLAGAGVQDALAKLAERGYQTRQCGVLLSAGRPVGDLESTLASHPAIHTAEGEFFRNALKRAGDSHGLAVSGIRERDLSKVAAERLRVSADDLQRRIGEWGKAIGPPWRQDEKLAALIAWVVLAEK